MQPLTREGGQLRQVGIPEVALVGLEGSSIGHVRGQDLVDWGGRGQEGRPRCRGRTGAALGISVGRQNHGEPGE